MLKPVCLCGHAFYTHMLGRGFCKACPDKNPNRAHCIKFRDATAHAIKQSEQVNYYNRYKRHNAEYLRMRDRL